MKNRKNLTDWFIYTLLALLAAITFLPILNIGFTTADDFEFFTTATNINNWLPDATHYAERTGRFYFLITKYFYSIPYIIDNPIYYYTVTILPLLLSFALLFVFLQKLTQNKTFTQMGGLLLLAIFSINHSHSAFTSYPFYFTFSFILCLSALILLLNYFKNNHYSYLISSASLFFITTIFYETYLTYYLLFFLLVIDRHSIKSLLKFKKPAIIAFMKEFGPYLFFCFLYLIIYLLYGHAHAGNYDGNSVSQVSIFNAIYNLLAMSIGSLPWANVMEYKSFVYQQSLQTSAGFSIFSLSTGAYVKAVLVGLLFALFASRITINRTKKQLLTYIAISAIFIAMPHFLLVISNKYNTNLFYTYVSTSFGFFAVVALFLFLYLFGVVHFSKNEKKLGIYNYIMGSILAITALFTQYVNEQISKDLSISKKRFEAVKEITPHHFDAITVLYAKDFYLTSSQLGWGIVQDFSATRYFSQKLGRDLRVETSYDNLYQQYKDSDELVGFLFNYQASKTGSTLLMVAKCCGNQLPEKRDDLFVDSLFCVQYATNKNFSISVLSDSTGSITLNSDTLQQRGIFHYGNVRYIGTEKMVSFSLTGERMIPSTFVLSDYWPPVTRSIQIGNYSWMYRFWRTLFYFHKIKRDGEWMKNIEQKAIENNISVNKAAWHDAQWVLDNMESQ